MTFRTFVRISWSSTTASLVNTLSLDGMFSPGALVFLSGGRLRAGPQQRRKTNQHMRSATILEQLRILAPGTQSLAAVCKAFPSMELSRASGCEGAWVGRALEKANPESRLGHELGPAQP